MKFTHYSESPYESLCPPYAVLRRCAEGYKVERYARSASMGTFSYEPLIFPKGELASAIGHAELWAGLTRFDTDPRPRMIKVPAYGADAYTGAKA